MFLHQRLFWSEKSSERRYYHSSNASIITAVSNTAILIDQTSGSKFRQYSKIDHFMRAGRSCTPRRSLPFCAAPLVPRSLGHSDFLAILCECHQNYSEGRIVRFTFYCSSCLGLHRASINMWLGRFAADHVQFLSTPNSCAMANSARHSRSHTGRDSSRYKPRTGVSGNSSRRSVRSTISESDTDSAS